MKDDGRKDEGRGKKTDAKKGRIHKKKCSAKLRLRICHSALDAESIAHEELDSCFRRNDTF